MRIDTELAWMTGVERMPEKQENMLGLMSGHKCILSDHHS